MNMKTTVIGMLLGAGLVSPLHADYQWEEYEGSCMREAAETGKMSVRISRMGGYGYRHANILFSPKTMEMLAGGSVFSGYGNPANIRPEQAIPRLSVDFYTYRGDYLFSCVPHDANVLRDQISKLMTINETLYQASRSQGEQRLQLLKNCRLQMDFFKVRSQLSYDTMDLIDFEIAALENNRDTKYATLIEAQRLKSELLACCTDAQSLINKIDELFPSCTAKNKRVLLWMKILMMLELAETQSDITVIILELEKLENLWPKNKSNFSQRFYIWDVRKNCQDDKADLLHEKNSRSHKTGKMMVPTSESFTERVKKRLEAVDKAK